MTPSKSLYLIFVTAPDAETARTLTTAILEARLGACVNIICQKIESHYRWKGKIERSPEVLMLIKTTKAKLKPLEKIILQKHPYDTPEFVAFPASVVAKKYLTWVHESVKSA